MLLSEGDLFYRYVYKSILSSGSSLVGIISITDTNNIQTLYI